MAVDIFLKLEGIKGESQDDKHKGEIDVLSWNWGATQTGTFHGGGGGGAGKANVQDIVVAKYLDASTPTLLQHCISGKHVAKATLVQRKAGHEAREYLKIEMENVLITAVSDSCGAGSDERPMETLSINFEAVKMEYKPQKKDGTLDAPVTMGWNIAQNKPA